MPTGAPAQPGLFSRLASVHGGIVPAMKRQAIGGTHRGPLGAERQRRTLRLVQALLVFVAAGLLFYAGYSAGVAAGFERSRDADALDGPRTPSWTQTVVLAVLGVGSLAAAFTLQRGGVLTTPTPARLEELTGRAEEAAMSNAVAADQAK